LLYDHYLSEGAAAGLNPSPLFDTKYYQEMNPDVVRAKANPLEHFFLSGAKEGRRPIPLDEPSLSQRVGQALNSNRNNGIAILLLILTAIRSGEPIEISRALSRHTTMKLSARDDCWVVEVLIEELLRLSGLSSRFELPTMLMERKAVCELFMAHFPENMNFTAIHAMIEFERGDVVSAQRDLELCQTAVISDEISKLTVSLKERIEQYRAQLSQVNGFVHSRDYAAAETALNQLSILHCGPDVLETKLNLATCMERREDYESAAYDAALQGCLPTTNTSLTKEATLRVASKRSDRLLLLDDAFPSSVSSFRFAEYSAYLEDFPNSVIYTRPDPNFVNYGESRSFFAQAKSYCETSGVDWSRIGLLNESRDLSSRVAYCVFLNLADIFFRRSSVPAESYLFTLYPGGGFALNDTESDSKLKRLCDNPKLKKIITTQRLSYDYLIQKGFCGEDRLCHIFGVVIPPRRLAISDQTLIAKRAHRFGELLNVCFVAHRYSPMGTEKGYDMFAKTVIEFSNSRDVAFHVIGNFDRNVIDLKGASNVTFYGAQPLEFFETFYPGMDIILSPNISMALLNPRGIGTFDGFPTTSVVEAGLHGVAMFVSDFHGMNEGVDGSPIFLPGEEIEVITRDASTIAERINFYVRNRDALARLANRGRSALLREFSFARQIKPRRDILKTFLEH
jgi:glycosyltransferase involved in cell wall biosynthesis